MIWDGKVSFFKMQLLPLIKHIVIYTVSMLDFPSSIPFAFYSVTRNLKMKTNHITT